MTDLHRVFLEPRFRLRCASCGAEFDPREYETAQAHVLNGGPKPLVEASASYPCLSCERAFMSEQGLAIHVARMHERAREAVNGS